MNSKGPKHEPWGTPQFNGVTGLYGVFGFTLCYRVLHGVIGCYTVLHSVT